MTNEERDLITRFVERVAGPAGAGGFASVPNTGAAPSLPAVDRDADSLLAELFQKYPEARYRITQVAVVQEQALGAATQRINAMQAELQRLQAGGGGPGSGGASPWGQAAQPAQSRGLFGQLFGSHSAPPPQAPQQAYAPPPQYAQQQPMGGAFQPRGSGFLGGALQTAAGVAGGVVAAEALTSLFSGGHGGGGMFGGAAAAPGESAWGSAAVPGAPAMDPFDQGGVAKDAPAADQYADNSAWTAPAEPVQQDTGWQDPNAGSGGDSGWQDSSGTDSGWTDSSSDA